MAKKSYFRGIVGERLPVYTICIKRKTERMMGQESRRIHRKGFSEEIAFESMLTGENRKGVVCLNGASTDISNGGLGLVAPYEAKQGEILKLMIPLRGLGVAVPVFAEVMWVQPFEASYKAGLRFLA